MTYVHFEVPTRAGRNDGGRPDFRASTQHRKFKSRMWYTVDMATKHPNYCSTFRTFTGHSLSGSAFDVVLVLKDPS